MDRWMGILRVPASTKGTSHCRIAASLCVSPLSKELIVPTANAIFFNGDRVEATGNSVIERLCDIQNIAEILVSKFGASINAWVIEASTFNEAFAVYNDFVPSLNGRGDPQSYKPDEFLASTSVVSLLSRFLEKRQRVKTIIHEQVEDRSSTSYTPSYPPKTIILGFSKGGIVINQLLTELAFVDIQATHPKSENPFIPTSRESFFNSISEVHYVDVGLNCPGAYITDTTIIESIAKRVIRKEKLMRFVLHGTPRQWRDLRRDWIRVEKDKLHHLLEYEGKKSEGRLHVCERLYFADKSPDLQMHFEIIEKLIVN